MVEVDTQPENTDTKNVEESATVQGKPEEENGKQEIMTAVQPDVSASESENKASAHAAASPVTPASTTTGGEEKTVDTKVENIVSPAGGNSRKRKREKVIKPQNTAPVSGNEQKPQDKKEEGQDDKGKSPATAKNSKRPMKKKAATDKPEASTKEDTKKESMGMIFMCSSKTKKDCYRYKVLGLPAAKKDMVANIYKGMRLFLFDVDLKLLYGIYKAAEPGGYNIEPKAFNSAFPSQVRFTVFEDCLPLAEEKFKAVIKDNYYAKNKFDCQLKAEQVKNLCKLFKATTAKSCESKHVRKPEARSFADQNRERGQGRDRERRPGQERNRRQGRDRELQRGRILVRRHVEDRVRRTRPEADAIYDNQPVILAPRLAYAYERPMDIDYHRRDLELSRREEIVYFDPHGWHMEPPAVHDRYLPPLQEPLYTRAHEAPLVYSRHPPPPAHETPVSYHESVYGRDAAPPAYILPHAGYRY